MDAKLSCCVFIVHISLPFCFHSLPGILLVVDKLRWLKTYFLTQLFVSLENILGLKRELSLPTFSRILSSPNHHSALVVPPILTRLLSFVTENEFLGHLSSAAQSCQNQIHSVWFISQSG